MALSSTEAEYMALSEAAKDATYLRRLLVELGFAKLGEVTIFCDNNGARKLAENPVSHDRSKHIDVRHHYVRKVLENGEVKIVYTPTAEMAADVLTTGLAKQKHTKCLDLLGMMEIRVPTSSRLESRGSVETRATSRIARATNHDDPGAQGRDRGPTGILSCPRRNANVAPTFFFRQCENETLFQFVRYRDRCCLCRARDFFLTIVLSNKYIVIEMCSALCSVIHSHVAPQ